MLLEVSNVSRMFSRNKLPFFAVENASLVCNYSDFIFIVGRSGSGKTTFLNLITGILESHSGSVLFEGRNIANMHDAEKSRYRNESIGFVPQNLGTLPNLSVIDNVRVPFFLFKHDGDSMGRAAGLLDMMGILHLKDEMPCNLSGGEARRVLIARALMNNPKILIADEPTANLDPETSGEVFAAIREVNRNGTAVLIVTHDASLVGGGLHYTMFEGHLSKS